MFSHAKTPVVEKKTPWFPSDTTPVRVGYYDTRIAVDTWVPARNHLGGATKRHVVTAQIRLYWNGKTWVASPKSKPYSVGVFQHFREWRGLFSHAKKKPRTFEQAWREDYEACGYQYGRDAIEQVRLGWKMAAAEFS